MSETEIRDEPMSEVEVGALLADARRHLKVGNGCGSCVAGVERLAATLAAARAEVARLRAALTEIRSFHGNSIDPDECMTCEAEQMPCRTARAADAALAPVEPSGDAESGTWANAYADPDQARLDHLR